MNIREITIEDAPQFLDLRLALDEESDYLLLEPGERNTSVDDVRAEIFEVLAAQNQMIFVVEDDGSLVGYIEARGGNYRRNYSTIYVVVAIREDYTGRGLGKVLFARVLEWAKHNRFHRLELTVMTHNTRAVRLYEKMGFCVEGIRRECLFVNGRYVDEYYMGLILKPQTGDDGAK